MVISMTKRAFTLVELLVVVGIMAAMATLSIGSYFAVVRGMADRGALAAATSVISLARDRACIDLQPTVVYFYNEVIQRENTSDDTDLVVAGVAVAVRRSGRVTRVNGNLIGDEFGDLNRIYDSVENESKVHGDTFRLYKFNFSQMDYSSVYSTVVEDSIGGVKYVMESPDPNVSKRFLKERETANEKDTELEDELISYAFKVEAGSASWKVGDAYGYEFARIRLPDNYIFGSGAGDVPKGGASDTDRIKRLNSLTIKCMPNVSTKQTALDKSVPIRCITPSGKWREVGDTLKKMGDA